MKHKKQEEIEEQKLQSKEKKYRGKNTNRWLLQKTYAVSMRQAEKERQPKNIKQEKRFHTGKN